MIITIIILGVVIILLAFSIRIVPQTHRGVIETLGKFNRVVQPGFHLIIPIIESMNKRNMTERLADVKPQDIITKDNLNARVDLQIYYKVNDSTEAIKNSYYFVDNFKTQIISLSQTTARNVIGGMKFVEVNSQRNELNMKLADIMGNEIKNWGVQIVRVELKEITPPPDVQETMNRVIKAQNEKDAAIDFATAVETQADGKRRAAIKEAEGIKQAKILEAEGQAEAIKLVNESAQKYFTGNAQELKKLETALGSFQNNSKIILSSDLVEKVSTLFGRQTLTQKENYERTL